MPERNSDRFLNSFAGIERHLRLLTRSDRSDSFYSLLEKAAKKNPSVRRLLIELKEYADLRNAIVHERIDGEPIAEPHDRVVERLESFHSLLTNPPRVESAFLRSVVTCEPNDRVRDVSHEMLKGAFSQLPVYVDRQLTGLLTAETLARWMAARFETHDGILEDETVEAVLPFTEDRENHDLVSRAESMFDVIERFDWFTRKGKSLDALIVTERASRSEKPLGIITIFDLPRIYELTGERHRK